MSDIDDLGAEVTETAEAVLGDLDNEERLQLCIEAMAGDDDERIERLTETAPVHTYETVDMQYQEYTKDLFAFSTLARYELERYYLSMNHYEAERDLYVALMLLNETLSRLSGGHLSVDEFGEIDRPESARVEPEYRGKHEPGLAYMATKYREIWDDLEADHLIHEEERRINYWPGLAAAGFLAYPNEFDGETIAGEYEQAELNLFFTTAELYKRFHAWEIFAEEHLGTGLDTLLNVAVQSDRKGSLAGPDEVSAELIGNTLSLYEDTLRGYEVMLREGAKEYTDDVPEIDLDAEAEAYAETLTDETVLPELATG